jgi:hypothetical protein
MEESCQSHFDIEVIGLSIITYQDWRIYIACWDPQIFEKAYAFVVLFSESPKILYF